MKNIFPFFQESPFKLASLTFHRLCRTGAVAMDVHPLNIVDYLVVQMLYLLTRLVDQERYVHQGQAGLCVSFSIITDESNINNEGVPFFQYLGMKMHKRERQH